MDEPKHQTVFDSDQQQVGEAYANALIGFGQQNGSTELLLEQLGGVVDVLHDVPKLNAALQSPGVAMPEKMSLLEKSLSKKVDGKLMNFLKIVLEKGRFDCLPAVRSSAEKIFDEMSGRVQATVTTAEPIDESVRKRIEESLSKKLGKKIQLTPEIDASVIGGMVVRIGDTVYDSSVKSQLGQVRTKAIKRASDAIRSSLDKFMAG